jgi:hypothetical protein
MMGEALRMTAGGVSNGYSEFVRKYYENKLLKPFGIITKLFKNLLTNDLMPNQPNWHKSCKIVLRINLTSSEETKKIIERREFLL